MSNIRRDLARLLLKPERGNGRLPIQPNRGPIEGKKSVVGPESGTGSDSADLTEVPDTREYHPISYLTSSDGLFVVERENSKIITLADSTGELFTREYADVQPE